ncbi:TPA: inverse autotransporter beta domain-containing protein [Escherichia coli]
MAGKAHGNGDRWGDNTICGLGDRLRRLTAGICLITQTIFPVMAAAPTHINHARSDTATSLILPNVKTIPYTLGALESPSTVAARFGITVDELRRLNQFRTFARGFDNVRQGDEIDVPLINSNSPEARNLKAMQMERDGKDPQMLVAEVAQQSGTLLARDMDSEQAASMARGWVASSASAQATDWLSRWGTARVSLGVDEDFSLKSSSFEFLHPWYETPDNLVFSQHTLHRTDDRTQTNHGIGWRYFTPSWMSGVNMFIDHDLTRYHTRTGMGVEYWRDQTVSMMAGNGATVAPTVITEPDGTVEIPVTSQTAGASAVTASINSSNASRNVTFVADVRTAQIADLVVIKDGSVADGAMANTLQVKVTDAFGNALAGQTVSVTAGNSATVAPAVTTNPDGTAEISVTSQTAGISTVIATINSSSLSQNVTFVPGDASQLTSTVETNKSNYTVGETITITVTLRDAFDNLVTGAASQLAANSVLTVDGTDPSETGSWVESGGVYTTTRMATIAGTDQHANLQLQTWSDGVTSDRYDIQSGSPAQATSTIATDKNAYTAGETITVAVTLKDAHGNLVEGGESLLSGDNVTVEGAVRSGEWSETAGVYTATWSAQMAGDSHHATLTLSEWGSSKQSESYSIHSGAPVQANSAIRTDKSAYIAGEPLTVTITLRDEFGNPALGLTSEVIESYIDNFAVGGATPDSMQWVEQNNGEYTIVWTAWVAEENLVASLKLKTWATEIKSSLYGIQPGAAAQTQSTIVTDKTKYIAGDSITVTVVLKDAQGNFITDGVAQLNEENVQVRNADSIQGNNWVYNGDGKYQRQYMAHFAEANLNAQLKMAGWSDANYSKNYTINRGEVSMLRSQLRIREVLVVAGADIPVSVLLSDEFGNPVNDGLDLLTDDAVYLQNVEKKHWSSWTFVGDGRYERTYMAYKEGENLNSYLHINGWYVGGQPSYTILPFVEVESLSVNGAKFRAADGFPKTGFDGAKFTLILTHNMKNTDYNWTSGIQGIQVDSNGMVTLEFIINKEVTITGTPKSNKGNKVTYKFSLQKWFIPQGIIQESWSEMNSYCIGNGYILPSSTDLVGSSTSGAVPRKVGSLWGEYGNLTSYDGIFRAEHYWLDSGMIFYPGDGHLSIAPRSSPLCMKTF